MNTVFFLNGTSSSGKTTIAKAFQEIMDVPVLYVSNDAFIFMLSKRDLNDDEIRPKILPPLLSAFHQSIPLIGQSGIPMVVDHVIECRDWMDELVACLAGFRTFSVKVECPLGELERRERERGDRTLGLAKWQLSKVHQFCEYDLVLDSHAHRPESNAQRLKKLFHSEEEPQAFETYRKEMRS